MDKDVEAGIVGSLSQIIKNKHIYYGSKPVHWCIESSSALAEAEVEYKDITSKAVCVNFSLSKHKMSSWGIEIEQYTGVSKVMAQYLSQYGLQHHGHFPLTELLPLEETSNIN